MDANILQDERGRNTFPVGQLVLLMLAHATADFYGSFYNPILPHIREQMQLSLTKSFALASVLMLTASFLQPVIGYLIPEGKRRTILLLGILFAMVMSLLGIVSTFGMLFVLLLIAGLGVGSVHPCGAALAAAAGRARKTLGVSIYMIGGSLGAMGAPLVVPALVEVNPRLLVFTAVFGATLIILLRWRLHPASSVRHDGHARHHISFLALFRRVAGIYLHVVLRSMVIILFAVLLPLHGTSRGLSLVQAGRVLAAFMLVGTLSSLAGGYLGDRLPRKKFIVLTELGAGIALLLAPAANGLGFYVLLYVGAMLAFLALPLQVIMAQERVPKAEGGASGFVMGFAQGTAALTLPLFGWLGDYWAETTGSAVIALNRELQLGATAMLAAAVVGLCLKAHATERKVDSSEGTE